jgi:hypothetical protein
MELLGEEVNLRKKKTPPYIESQNPTVFCPVPAAERYYRS